MIVYFDTNVFDHVDKGFYLSNVDENTLKLARKEGRISIVFSYLNLEEVLSALPKFPARVSAQLRLILEIADKRRFVKPANMLLADDIRCYAEGKALPEPFIAMDDFVQSYLQTLVCGTEPTDELLEIITEAQKEKAGFARTMKEADEEVLPYAKAVLRDTHGRPPEWGEYWDRLAEEFAKGFAAPLNLDSCYRSWD